MFKAGNKINIPKYATVLIGNPATVLPKELIIAKVTKKATVATTNILTTFKIEKISESIPIGMILLPSQLIFLCRRSATANQALC